MKRKKITDLTAFVVVAEERSFTRATARLGMAQSALSQIMCCTEEQLGLWLLTRITRSVVPTEAGEHLLFALSSMSHDIDPTLVSLSRLQNHPSGIMHIVTVGHAARTMLLPAMHTFLKSHPEIDIQLTIDYGLTDVVSKRFDAGVHLSGEIDKDMVTIRIRPDMPMATAGSPDYSSCRSVPTSVSQSIDHQVINLYFPASGTADCWRLIRGGCGVRARMEDQLLLNTTDLIIDATIDGHGLTYLPYDQVERTIKKEELIRVLDKFTPDLPGYHLCYPHRQHAGPAFSLLIDRLKYEGAAQHYLLIH